MLSVEVGVEHESASQHWLAEKFLSKKVMPQLLSLSFSHDMYILTITAKISMFTAIYAWILWARRHIRVTKREGFCVCTPSILLNVVVCMFESKQQRSVSESSGDDCNRLHLHGSNYSFIASVIYRFNYMCLQKSRLKWNWADWDINYFPKKTWQFSKTCPLRKLKFCTSRTPLK